MKERSTRWETRDEFAPDRWVIADAQLDLHLKPVARKTVYLNLCQ
jgi:hypothetical protein